MIVNHNINNLSGGVSRQPDENRFDNQVEEMTNFEPFVTGIIRRRNPLVKIGEIANHTSNMTIHSYSRGDSSEKYFMILSDNGLKVYSIDGVEKTVNVVGTTDPLTKWSGTSWKDSIKFLTVGDTTWILNSEMTVATTGELTDTLSTRDKAFYWLKRSFDNGAGEGYNYTIVINDLKFTTNNIDSDEAAKTLSEYVNQQYSNVDNDPSVFPDYIRAVNIGSIVYVYIAPIYAPDFRIHAGTINTFVRVKRKDTGTIFGADVLDYETSFNLINGTWELYCDVGGTLAFYDLTTVTTPATITVPYYNNASQASSNTTPENISMTLYSTNGSEEFTFSSSDSWGEQASIGWKDSVAKIADLPASMDGFTTENVGIVEITGTDRTEFTSYYLKWDGEAWVETVKGGIEKELDMTTLPAKLVRLSDGTFALGFNENLDSEGFYTQWEERLKGDDDSNPLPSFVGYKISNMFFFRNRLGFTSEENVLLSEVSNYYNFFATTMLEVLDGDPIDVSIDSDSVSILRNVNAVAGSLTLWSDDSQYILSGGEVLSPATTRVSKSSSYFCDNTIPPVLLDNEIIFFSKSSNVIDVKAYSAASINTDKSSAESISSNILGYLPNTINRVEANSGSNMMFLLDSEDAKVIYVYKYHIQNNEKIMSSWFKWTFDEDIKDIFVLDNKLYLLNGTNSLSYIETSIKDIDDLYLDNNTTPYLSEIVMSKYNIETKQGTRAIREPFYIKTVKINCTGLCDLGIINTERDKTKIIKSKHLARRLFVGGNSNKVQLKLTTEYDTGCEISTLNLEGLIKTRSTNI